ncbi:MAG: hypothetical protein FWF43_09155, partial [Propionibacteriaceae bacterium]|nr:hypothetical protein [Propionibacteriaceae bacterium]
MSSSHPRASTHTPTKLAVLLDADREHWQWAARVGGAYLTIMGAGLTGFVVVVRPDRGAHQVWIGGSLLNGSQWGNSWRSSRSCDLDHLGVIPV